MIEIPTGEMAINKYELLKAILYNENKENLGGLARIIEISIPFFLEKNILELCNPNHTSNKIYFRNHPFDVIFIGNSFLINNTEIQGILIYPAIFNKDGIVDYNFVAIIDSNIIMNPLYYDDELKLIKINKSFKIQSKLSTNLNIEEQNKFWKISHKIRIFIINFLDFLNNPDIKIIDKEHSESSIKRHADNNKPVLPKYKIVTITGEQKIYIDSLNKGEHKDYSHKFWVRGHFMNLKANRYKTNIGKKIWRKAHIKGKGELIIKDYQLKKEVSK